MIKNRLIHIILLLIITGINIYAQEQRYYSPDGKLKLTINTDEGIKWSLKYNDVQIILPSVMEMEFATVTIPGSDFKVKKVTPLVVREWITPELAIKDEVISNDHTDLVFEFRKDFRLHFKIYNDGFAYRFETEMKQKMIVLNERSVINFPEGTTSWYPLEDEFMSHNERTYIETVLDTINENHLASLPTLVKANGINVLITETALENYPGMWLRGVGSNTLQTVFPAYPREERLFGDRDMRVMTNTDFISETDGERAFPWRLFIVSESDGGLIESNLTYLLADTCRLPDTDWIKPGKAAWDWWNANNLYGVDFKSGINNETYKYYIDFAAANGIEYVILDEGWYQLGDLFDISPGIDVQELCDYAGSKGVGVILWVVWKTLDNQLDKALAQFEAWGVKGIKVDFMQRDDQKMVEYYYKVAKKAADHKLLVNYHGAYKPAGLRRTYPNVLTREGVKGLENSKWSKSVTPDHDVTIPFIRMVAGPMDYTPGAMINLGESNFSPMYTRPASQGTRVHQMAMYVAYESPLQMLADNPVNYKREQECTDFICMVPVAWDETKVIEGKVGDYLVIARRKGETWYIGALTDRESREFDLDISFMKEGEYNVTVFYDGINAARYASDYNREEKTISTSGLLNIKMAPGGGWVAKFERVSR